MSCETQSQLADRDEQQRRAKVMELCEVGEDGGQQIYKLGKAHVYWPLWAKASDKDKRAWRIIILATVDGVCECVYVCLVVSL